ncbi:MAG: cleavage stimulation factor, 3' pre-RNA, subunit 1, variant 2 [Marteilia pararefringens]
MLDKKSQSQKNFTNRNVNRRMNYSAADKSTNQKFERPPIQSDPAAYPGANRQQQPPGRSNPQNYSNFHQNSNSFRHRGSHNSKFNSSRRNSNHSVVHRQDNEAFHPASGQDSYQLYNKQQAQQQAFQYGAPNAFENNSEYQNQQIFNQHDDFGENNEEISGEHQNFSKSPVESMYNNDWNHNYDGPVGPRSNAQHFQHIPPEFNVRNETSNDHLNIDNEINNNADLETLGVSYSNFQKGTALLDNKPPKMPPLLSLNSSAEVGDESNNRPLINDNLNKSTHLPHNPAENVLLPTIHKEFQDNFKFANSLLPDNNYNNSDSNFLKPELNKKELYTMISQQLLNDGYAKIASQIIDEENIEIKDIYPSASLQNSCIMRSSSKSNPLDERKENWLSGSKETTSQLPNSPSLYKTNYITTHKDSCICASFSSDSSFFATGSADKSFKVIDTNRVTNKNDSDISFLQQSSQQQPYDIHPVIRTFCEHQAPISCLKFHPHDNLIFSSDNSGVLQAFSFSSMSHTRAHHVLQEVSGINAFEIHPAGQHFILSTHQPTLRLYDIETFSCFVSPMVADQHSEMIVGMSYNSSGSFYITSSRDLSFKIWDGRSGRCVNTVKQAMPTNLVSADCALDRRVIIFLIFIFILIGISQSLLHWADLMMGSVYGI